MLFTAASQVGAIGDRWAGTGSTPSDLWHKLQGVVIVAVRRGAKVAVVRNTNSGQTYEMVS